MSSISNIFQQLHGILDPSTLELLKDRPDVVPTKQLQECVDYLQVDIDKLFYDPNNIINRTIYYDGLIYMPLHGMNIMALKTFHAREALQHMKQKIDELLHAKNYEMLFHVIDKKILIPAFVKYYTQIPKSQLYDVFIDLYQRTEYGFDKIPKEAVQAALDVRSKSHDWQQRINLLKSKTKNKEFVKIYRGETNKSTPDNMSWTLSKKVAHFFATRFNSDGDIKTKTVRVADILDYLTSRNEEEVFYITHKS